MQKIPPTFPLPTMPPAQDFILGLANQVVPHTGSWSPLATAVNYLARIVPIVYLAFQAQLASPVGFQLDSVMGWYINIRIAQERIRDYILAPSSPPSL
ncbi:hypothetical protein DSO57_1000138 [Entomophthora muscae]|uniref:Uncharacterized protein n=1 Tax=Entomophthora muscae TaxID=34485 RepID=A0ACC2SMI8_9FUNG|nr:hypothetical protein DSO57_1000138 [Entomophthora muscae]